MNLLQYFPQIKRLLLKVKTSLQAFAVFERLLSHAGLLFTHQLHTTSGDLNPSTFFTLTLVIYMDAYSLLELQYYFGKLTIFVLE